MIRATSSRTRQALHAAAVFCVVAIGVYALINLTVGMLPSLMHWFLLPALASLFLTAFIIWWLTFRRARTGLFLAIPAGFLIANLWPLPLAVGVFMGGLGLPGLLNLETWTPTFLVRAVIFSIPYILLALVIRWRQARKAAAHNHAGQGKF